MAPTYFVGSRDRHPTAIAAPRSLLQFFCLVSQLSFMQSAAAKALLRAEVLARRGLVTEGTAAAFARRIAEVGAALAAERSARTAAAYWPIKGEASPMLLLEELAFRHVVTALPVMIGRDRALVFRRWRPGERPAATNFGIMEPPADRPQVKPDLIFVPLVAFDRRGYRLGYGAGFYDRTLAELRASGQVTAVGIAYAVQEVPDLPAEAHDQRLDFVLTEREWIDCKSG
jgi:5-formyltetrahydrofolate cyclo-ligase